LLSSDAPKNSCDLTLNTNQQLSVPGRDSQQARRTKLSLCKRKDLNVIAV